jgi:hypothetical protein
MKMNMHTTLTLLTALLLAPLAALHAADAPPTHYTAKAPVPGLVDMAMPGCAAGA